MIMFLFLTPPHSSACLHVYSHIALHMLFASSTLKYLSVYDSPDDNLEDDAFDDQTGANVFRREVPLTMHSCRDVVKKLIQFMED